MLGIGLVVRIRIIGLGYHLVNSIIFFGWAWFFSGVIVQPLKTLSCPIGVIVLGGEGIRGG